jgi:hypothetical protein
VVYACGVVCRRVCQFGMMWWRDVGMGYAVAFFVCAGDRVVLSMVGIGV